MGNQSDDNQTDLQSELARADQLYKAGDHKQADQLYRALSLAYPKILDLALLSGKLAFEVDDHDRAIDVLSRLLTQRPDDPSAQYILGKSLFIKGNLPAAQSIFSKLVAAYPEFDHAWCALARIYSDQHKAQEAHDILIDIIKRNVTFYEAYLELYLLFKKQHHTMTSQAYLKLYNYFSPTPLPENKNDRIKDTLFLNPEEALSTARQENRVFQTIAISAPQICYYQGTPFEDPPNNLIAVPPDKMVQFFATTRLRLPTTIQFNVADKMAIKEAFKLAENFDNAKIAIKTIMKDNMALCQSQAPRFPLDGPPTIVMAASRLTTVMQYCSRDLAFALKRKGVNVRYIIEDHDLEELSMHHLFQVCAHHTPHAVIHLNHVNNYWLHPDTYNIIWWQDLMPDLKEGRPISWRKRDISLSSYPQFDSYLYSSGIDAVYRQDFCVDLTRFSNTIPTKERKKIVFIGNSHIIAGTKHGHSGTRIAAILKEKMENGEDITDDFLEHLSVEYDIPFLEIFDALLPYVFRDTSVEWLCSMADSLDYEVEVYGRWWDLNPIVNPYFKGELPHGPAIARVYNQAKYSIAALHRLVHSQRVVEISACGAIPVIFDQRAYSEKPHWEKECLYFKTKEEMRACFAKIPENDPETIADHYSYDQFADRIITLINSGKYPAPPLPNPKKPAIPAKG
ncbi:MAG: tetratricopeptide repeat protein [Magnetococcales bacterium]|nr:tetratricopeptide repeat protein [Magnetococcales bacterium]